MTQVTRMLREERPSSKVVTIENFSVIKERYEPYESSIFEASGYKWMLLLYVNGNKNDGGNGHISLYVRIEETKSLPKSWEVNVDLKLFVLKRKEHKYLTVTDGTVKRFTESKTEWGFGQLIPLSTLYNTNEGYIMQDTCSFGAEILIINPVQQQEKVTFISNPSDIGGWQKCEQDSSPENVFTWRVVHFSTLEDRFYYSDAFLVGHRYWKLGFNPKGIGVERSHTLSIYIFGQGFKPNAVQTSTWGAFNLRLKNQRSSNHIQKYSAALCPIRSGFSSGVNIILFKDLNDASKGYLVDDTIIFEAEMVKASVTNIVPI